MKTVGIDKDITIADRLRFVIKTTDRNDYPMRPYRVDEVRIYFITREFTDLNASEFAISGERDDLKREYERLRREVGLSAKRSVRLATTGPLSLNGLAVVDGLQSAEYDRVLVKNQANPSLNGIYVTSSGPWTRSDDADSGSDFTSDLFVTVEEGDQNGGTGWALSRYSESSARIEPGTSPINFIRFATEVTDGSMVAPNERIMRKIERLEVLSSQIEQSATKSSFFYKNATVVKTFGSPGGVPNPAWINPDLVPQIERGQVILDNVLQENEESGTFTLEWDAAGCREGDYVVCWSWRPTLGSEVLSSHLLFSIGGNTSLTTSIPTHRTLPGKYETLMDRYLPEMFKGRLTESDLSPLVLKGFNDAVAGGFTFLEDFVNQMIDLLDSNATHEQLLPLLSNLFNLKLKSNDPTLWRRQIKRAMPQFKQKGTIVGLKNALADAGMEFLKLTKLWQVVSKYTYQEHFEYSGDNSFVLSREIVLPVDGNFGLWLRRADEDWIDLSSSSPSWHQNYVSFSGDIITWIGSQLEDGDSIRILYKFKEIPSSQQSLETYLRSLPLMDNRDERLQGVPRKNWNVHLVAEDDEMFHALVPTLHPLADPTVWGRIRTEFPYSENAYNMDEYNGSKRDSINPCDIGPEFVDGCGGCQSSTFNIDMRAENLSDESFDEARKVVEEHVPFHAVIGTFSLFGAVNEFLMPSEERVEAMLSYRQEDAVLAGEGQNTFNRVVVAAERDLVRRELLATISRIDNPNSISGEWSGKIRNQHACLFPRSFSLESELYSGPSGTHGFESANVNTTDVNSSDVFKNDNMLEILGTSVTRYSISEMGRNSARIFGGIDNSLVGKVVEYRISNRIADDLSVQIQQADRMTFSDEDVDFTMFPVVTKNDFDLGLSEEEPWTVSFGGDDYTVIDMLPNGTLLLGLEGPAHSSSSGLSWTLSGMSEIKSGSAGSFEVESYGLVTAASEDVRSLVRIGDFVHHGSNVWRIRSLKRGSTDKFFIEDYEDGSQIANVKVYRRIIENKVGQLGYEGIVLETSSDLMGAMGLSGGADSEDVAPFMIFVGSEGAGNFRYYTIIGKDGDDFVLGGPLDDFTTEGQSVVFTLNKFNKERLTLSERDHPPVPGHIFDGVDRSGAVLISQTGGGSELGFASMLLNSDVNPIDIVNQSESISFEIEHKEKR